MYFISFLRYLIVISALVFLPIQTSLGKPLQVVASFSIISDLAKQVGKEHVEIKTLVDREGDVHHYEPKPTDVVKLNKADLILMNGLQFEGFLPRLLAASETSAP